MEHPLEFVAQKLGVRVKNKTLYAGELTLTIDKSELYAVLKVLKEQFDFDYLVDIFATDLYQDGLRFEVNYNIMNLKEKKRLRIKCLVEEDAAELPSVVDLWPSAAWNERETWDMMGVSFTGNPDLRRIYMPEDFEYFPLRKEFPLIGIPGSIEMPEKDPPKEYK